MAVAEPEFAFKIGKTLEPKKIEYFLEEVMQAVDTLHLSLLNYQILVLKIFLQ